MDVPISPDLIEQPIKRVHRSGQTKPVNAYFTFAKGTIDERLYGLIVEKSGDINNIIDVNSKKGIVRYDEIPELLFKELTNK
jgi:SNF2 family DNA or RNA helicase